MPVSKRTFEAQQSYNGLKWTRVVSVHLNWKDRFKSLFKGVREFVTGKSDRTESNIIQADKYAPGSVISTPNP